MLHWDKKKETDSDLQSVARISDRRLEIKTALKFQQQSSSVGSGHYVDLKVWVQHFEIEFILTDAKQALGICNILC